MNVYIWCIAAITFMFSFFCWIATINNKEYREFNFFSLSITILTFITLLAALLIGEI